VFQKGRDCLVDVGTLMGKVGCLLTVASVACDLLMQYFVALN
jgi:hypothetical protein